MPRIGNDDDSPAALPRRGFVGQAAAATAGLALGIPPCGPWAGR
jgi:hypothetical protein